MNQTQSLTPLETRDGLVTNAKQTWPTIKGYVDELPKNFKDMLRSEGTRKKESAEGVIYELKLDTQWPWISLYLEGVCMRDSHKGFGGWTKVNYYCHDKYNNNVYIRNILSELSNPLSNDRDIDLIFPDVR
jgi:hypothetical protein